MVSRKTRIGEFETAAATETCLAMMHNKVPANKTDPGSFTIPCSIGNNYSCKALCDPGASINLMPKSVFKKLGIGEAKPTTVMLQLADRSYVQPEGKIEDLIVRVDKFIFHADFLILDCEADEHAPIILGIPFLATSRIMIDFEKGELVLRVDGEQVKITVFSVPGQQDTAAEECKIIKISRTHREKRDKLSRSETAGSQNRVRNASAVTSELGRSLMLPSFILTLSACYKKSAFTFTTIAHSSSSSTDGLPSRFRNAVARARYNNIVAAKNKWEEQVFFFDYHLENYGLEPLIYKRLSDLGWLRFGRQAAQANLSWTREFYVHNAKGNDATDVRGRRVPANLATINTLIHLPDNLPSIYELIGALEDVDYDIIKDQLCLPGTTWNITGKNPGTISRPQLLPEAKLWNTFVKRNLMPTSHNQTVDRTRLNEKGILAFPCIISALCRRAAVPSYPTDKYTKLRSGWTRKEYMRKIDLTDAVPLQTAKPTPPASHQSPTETPAPSPADAQNDTLAANPMNSPAHTHEAPASFASTPVTPPSPPVAQPPSTAPTTNTSPLHILHLCNQIQRIEVRQLTLIEETKVFQNRLINFLCFKFPHTVNFFPTQPTTAPPPAAASAANPSAEDGQTEPIN
ncbi:hypothetical protein V6N13_008068 [Hibiscus sabdariffa]